MLFGLLEVDNYPQLPADAEIRLAVTGTDVIHSFAVTKFSVKIDAIPGRLNQFEYELRSPVHIMDSVLNFAVLDMALCR